MQYSRTPAEHSSEFEHKLQAENCKYSVDCFRLKLVQSNKKCSTLCSVLLERPFCYIAYLVKLK